MKFLYIQFFLLILFTLSIATLANAQTPQEYYDRGVSKFNKGEYESGVSDFQKAIELDVNYVLKAQAYVNIAWYYNQLGDRKQAIEICDKALSIDAMNIAAYTCKANANLALGNRQEALKDFNQVLILDPKNIHAYAARGTIYQALGNYKQAIKNLDTAISIAPSDSPDADIMLAYLGRGISKLKLGDEIAGCQDLTKAWQLGYYKAYEFVQQFCTKIK